MLYNLLAPLADEISKPSAFTCGYISTLKHSRFVRSCRRHVLCRLPSVGRVPRHDRRMAHAVEHDVVGLLDHHSAICARTHRLEQMGTGQHVLDGIEQFRQRGGASSLPHAAEC